MRKACLSLPMHSLSWKHSNFERNCNELLTLTYFQGQRSVITFQLFHLFTTINFLSKNYKVWRAIITLSRFIDWLIIYGFTSRSRIFYLYGDVTIAGEGLQNLDLCSVLRAVEQGGIFIVPHLLRHGTNEHMGSSEVSHQTKSETT
jgi:hypothetical protein